MKEIWKDIVGYENLYEVSNLGRVKSKEKLAWNGHHYRKLPSKFRSLRNGEYLDVNLCKYGKVKRLKVHRLVAEAFIPNTENKETVNHIDGNKYNNRVDNLEWNTWSENTRHAIDNGLMVKEGQRFIKVIR